MSTRLFDSYLVVDWSAGARPVTGPDSIWWHLLRPGSPPKIANPPTRAAAVSGLADLLARESAAGRRVFAGFDFPFGWPAGAAARVTGRKGWEALWQLLAGRIEDGPENANTRFAAAAAFNAALGGDGPFWGNGGRADIDGLPRLKPTGYGTRLPREWRIVERRQRELRLGQPKSVWQLAGAGAVGSQVLMGLPALLALRADPRLAGRVHVWPFETGLEAPAPAAGDIVLAEVYPSLLPTLADPGEVKDASQCRRLAGALATLDAEGALGPLFTGDPDLSPEDRNVIATEEAWILGAAHEAALRDAAETGTAGRPSSEPALAAANLSTPVRSGPRVLRYERDPHEIYRQSFAAVREATRLDHLPEDLHDTAIRLVHACGMPDITARLAWSGDVAARARAALQAGAPILCDAQMVVHGIVRQRLPAGNEVLCLLSDPRTDEVAEAEATTRSAAAVDLWEDRIEDAVIAIGNAPTALFRLLERLDAGWPRPAAILGFPVGFVGAAESKAELARDPRGAPFLTLRGRRGGSALAAAAVNALAAGLEPPR